MRIKRTALSIALSNGIAHRHLHHAIFHRGGRTLYWKATLVEILPRALFSTAILLNSDVRPVQTGGEPFAGKVSSGRPSSRARKRE